MEWNDTAFLSHLFALWMRKNPELSLSRPQETGLEFGSNTVNNEDEEEDEMMEEEEEGAAGNSSKSGRKILRMDRVPPPYL